MILKYTQQDLLFLRKLYSYFKKNASFSESNSETFKYSKYVISQINELEFMFTKLDLCLDGVIPFNMSSCFELNNQAIELKQEIARNLIQLCSFNIKPAICSDA